MLNRMIANSVKYPVASCALLGTSAYMVKISMIITVHKMRFNHHDRQRA